MHLLISKYKYVLLPLLMVLIFDVSLLVLNFHLSSELEISANNINISGRQRMLSQKITKNVALLKIYGDENSGYDQKMLIDLAQAVDLFDHTLSAFLEGGSATSASGDKRVVEKLTDPQVISILHQAKIIWTPLFNQLHRLTEKGNLADGEFTLLINALTDKNLALLALMNDLTNHLEQDARQKTYFLRGLQMIVIGLVFMSFFVASFRLYRRERYYDSLMEKTTDVVLSIDVRTEKITFVSSSVSDLLGHDASYYQGQPAELIFAGTSKNILAHILDHVFHTGELEQSRYEIQLQKQDGSIIYADMVTQLLVSQDGHSQELSADIRDISERKQAEVALADLAHKDGLTGLVTRSLFFEIASHSLSLAKRANERVAIVFIDLDDFKAVNDNFGHGVGDAVLKTVAERLNNCLRESDTACRFGGDEFVVLIESVDKSEELEMLADKIVNTINQVIPVGEFACHVGVSVGIAIYPDNGDDIETLIKLADQAMYHVKSNGKRGVSFVKSEQ